MAKRKDLKKKINDIATMVTSACLLELQGASEEKREDVFQLMDKALNLHNDIICRISHTEPGNVKGFYAKLKKDFEEGIDEIFKGLEEVSGKK